MGDLTWEVDEWGYLRWDGQVIYRGEGPFPLKYDAAYDALVAAVRDSERLPAVTAERDALRAAGNAMAEELAKHGWGDFHYGDQPQDSSVVQAIQQWRDALASSPDTERVTPEQAAELAAVREATGVGE